MPHWERDSEPRGCQWGQGRLMSVNRSSARDPRGSALLGRPALARRLPSLPGLPAWAGGGLTELGPGARVLSSVPCPPGGWRRTSQTTPYPYLPGLVAPGLVRLSGRESRLNTQSWGAEPIGKM